jgi:hypothetical protein
MQETEEDEAYANEDAPDIPETDTPDDQEDF